VLRVLLLVVTLLVVLSIAGQFMVHYLPDFRYRDSIARLVYVDEEQSVPTLYSVLVLIADASVFAIIAHAHRRTGRADAWNWAALSLLFLSLALDEALSLHERTVDPLRELLGIEGGPLWFAWVVPAILVVTIFGIAFIGFYRRLDRPTRGRLGAAGALFVGGAVGVEMIGAWYASGHGAGTMTFALLAAAEEALEMLGATLALYGLLAHIASGLPDVEWRIRVGTVRI
jgi:hypothetical protein